MVKWLGAFGCALLLSSFSLAQSHKPGAPVNDSATAIKIAEKALFPVYGKRKIQSAEPFAAELQPSVWIVTGTLHCPGGRRWRRRDENCAIRWTGSSRGPLQIRGRRSCAMWASPICATASSALFLCRCMLPSIS